MKVLLLIIGIISWSQLALGQTAKIPNIPRLNIKEEPRITAEHVKELLLPALVSNGNSPLKKELQTPQEIFIDSYLIKKIKQASNAKNLFYSDPKKDKLPIVPTMNEVPVQVNTKVDVNEGTVQELSPSELKLLQALIFSEIHKNYKLALGLFAELVEDREVKEDAIFHLAETSYHLGLYLEFKHQMTKLLKSNNKDLKKKAIVSLISKTQPGDKELVKTLLPHLGFVENYKGDQFRMNIAQYYIEKSDLTNALSTLDEVVLDSPLFYDSLFLKSVLMYKAGQLEESIGLMQTVMKHVEKNKSKSDLYGVTALTLARLHFQAGQYKEAFDTYLKVDKRHPEWIQAMIEQAWAQILAEDYEGAAGNMFSLHTEFFKNAFVPESYVVRTVGYLNLCQYGDGAKVVSNLKNRFTPVKKQMEEYQSKKKTDIAYYDTIRTWGKNPDLKNVDGLPRDFIYTLTRHPSFMEEQKMINSIEEQFTKLDNVALEIIKSERELMDKQEVIRKDISKIRTQIIETKSDKRKIELETELEKANRRLLSNKIQHHIAKKARISIKDLRQTAMKRLDAEKSIYLSRAGRAVKTRFAQMVKTLSQTLDQADILQYELFSGAGEHLRYQMAGGDINEKDREKLKVEGDQAMNWEFKGEVWQDELGHFRSSLKNVCPPEEKISHLGN